MIMMEDEEKEKEEVEEEIRGGKLEGGIPRCVINGVRNKFWEQKKKQDL
jgi:hypothetical protein